MIAVSTFFAKKNLEKNSLTIILFGDTIVMNFKIGRNQSALAGENQAIHCLS